MLSRRQSQRMGESKIWTTAALNSLCMRKRTSVTCILNCHMCFPDKSLKFGRIKGRVVDFTGGLRGDAEAAIHRIPPLFVEKSNQNMSFLAIYATHPFGIVGTLATRGCNHSLKH